MTERPHDASMPLQPGSLEAEFRRPEGPGLVSSGPAMSSYGTGSARPPKSTTLRTALVAGAVGIAIGFWMGTSGPQEPAVPDDVQTSTVVTPVG